MRALVLLLLLGSCLPAQDERPNILVVVTDDQRHDMLACAGHPVIRTPALDALARRGMRFNRAFVTTPICAASRASIFTGLEERTHGYTFGTPPFSDDLAARSYPSLLKGAGYRTGFVGKLGVRMSKKARAAMFDTARVLRQPYVKKRKDGGEEHITRTAAKRAIEFMYDAKTDPRPFCLTLCFNAPHAQDHDKVNHYPAPAPMHLVYRDVPMPQPRWTDTYDANPEFLKASLNRVRWFWHWDTTEKYERNMRDYFRMISGIDFMMGEVFEAMKTLGLATNTVVVFTSDNGYYLGDRGFAGKWSHYDQSLRVPLIIADPRVPAARRGQLTDRMVLNIDLAPTVVELARVRADVKFTGVSLAPLVRGDLLGGAWRTSFFCEHRFAHKQIPRWVGLRDERWSYARYYEQDPPHEFLHDLRADPHQLVNLAGDSKHAATLAKLRARAVE